MKRLGPLRPASSSVNDRLIDPSAANLRPALVTRVRDEDTVFGFRYDTLEGHIESGMEWFLLTKDERGDIRFRIEARWRHGNFPNWWSRLGFMLLSGPYPRHWHREAHLLHETEVAPMTRPAIVRILALGALTGMRSMAGPATIAFRYGGPIRKVALVLAAGEMIVDKLPFVGDRIEAAPLVGRALMGALAGGLIAREAKSQVAAGAAVGAAAAVAAAHIAYRVRQGLGGPGLAGGLLEDAIVLGAGAVLTRR